MKPANRARIRWLAASVVLWPLGATAWAQNDSRTQRVQFTKGSSSATVNGRIKGYETVDYVVGARKGQAANISLASKHSATYFNVLAPGQKDVAFFNGSTSGNRFEGVLPETGDYRVRVYMMRSAARRNEVADYRLEVIIGAAASAAAPPVQSTDAQVPGTNYHATGTLPCATGGGQPTGSCAFGVQREGQGNGRVTITTPAGRTRTIFFGKGRATGYDAGHDDKGTFSARRQGDLTIVRIGEERFEIPDAVINGG